MFGQEEVAREVGAGEAAHAGGVLRALERGFGAGETVAGVDAGEVALEAAGLGVGGVDEEIADIGRGRIEHELLRDDRDGGADVAQIRAQAGAGQRRGRLVAAVGVRRDDEGRQLDHGFLVLGFHGDRHHRPPGRIGGERGRRCDGLGPDARHQSQQAGREADGAGSGGNNKRGSRGCGMAGHESGGNGGIETGCSARPGSGRNTARCDFRRNRKAQPKRGGTHPTDTDERSRMGPAVNRRSSATDCVVRTRARSEFSAPEFS
jgi:hypothetical protein